jgi:uncharacterized protein YgbK (DUF1537 family)
VTRLARDPARPASAPAIGALRLLADDMTGALDTAAAFCGLVSPLRVGIAPVNGRSLVLDTGTREKTPEEATLAAAAAAPLLAPSSGRLSYFKVDSLLRGHAGRELAAILATTGFDRVIIAPAMPEQGRRTRSGRQHWMKDGAWTPTGEDLGTTLGAAGHPVARLQPGDEPAPGISLFDASTAADLDGIVGRGLLMAGSLLWVGSAGLARALARALSLPSAAAAPAWHSPLLGLIGTDHPVTAAQLAAVPQQHLRLHNQGPAAINDLLASTGAAFVTCDLGPGTARAAARAAIADRFSALIPHVPRPGTLLVSGGETLRSLLPALDATGLDVLGELQPGIPLSRLTEGPWRGTAVISKSGAFGEPCLLAALAVTAGHATADMKNAP